MKLTKIEMGVTGIVAALALTSFSWAATQTQATQEREQQKAGQSYSQPGQQKAQMPEAVRERELAINPADRRFLQRAAHLNAAGLQLAELAERQSQDQNVRRASQQIIKENSQLNQQLRGLAEQKGVSLSFEPNAAQRRIINAIASKSGAEFNQLVVLENIKGHERAVMAFQRASQGAADPDIRKWATQSLPDIKGRLAQLLSGHLEQVGERPGQKAKPQIKSSPSYQQKESGKSSGY